MNPPQIPYRIEQTRNRSSRAVLASDNTVIIRLARGLSMRERDEHTSWLLQRMLRLVERERQKTIVDPFRAMLVTESSSTILLPASGRNVSFVIEPSDRTKARWKGSYWHIEKDPQTDQRTFHRLLWRVACLSERAWIEAEVRRINAETLNVPISSVNLRYMKTLWGSCSSTGKICLSTSLLFVPHDLLRYVIIHELAHRIHRNHSERFWQTVESVCPETKAARAALRKYRAAAL